MFKRSSITITREELRSKHQFMRRMINAGMLFFLLIPVSGIVALLCGFFDTGNGEENMSSTAVCVMFFGVGVFLLIMWKLFLVALNWIVKGQNSLLFGEE